MHDTALKSGGAFFDVYLRNNHSYVLDVGSADFNGSLRDVKPANATYIGVDLFAGKGVDIVVKAGEPLPFDADSFDAVVSNSCFEHDPMFWSTFLQMLRVVKSNGYVYINAPSNGPYHSYPGDNWRFYPDSGIALSQWAKSQGFPIQLIESGTLMRKEDIWNDFVAVFQKSESPPPRTRFMLDAFPDASNVRRFPSDSVERLEQDPQDLKLLYEARGALQAASCDLVEARRMLSEKDTSLKITKNSLIEKEALVALLQRNLEEKENQLSTVYLSHSWRVTSPLRWIRRYLI
jgi:SAM-dependent methyltransferase